MADLVHLRSESGNVMAFGLPLPYSVEIQYRRGDLVLCHPDGRDLTDEQVDEAAHEDAEDAPALPKRSAARKVWVEFAVEQGMDRTTAAAMTRDELVAEFTRLRAVS